MYFNNSTNSKKCYETGKDPAADTAEGPRPRGGAAGSGGVECAALSTAHIRPQVEYYRGASLFKVSKGVECEAVGGGQRGQVHGFSKQSRRRLMQTIAKVRKDADLPCFVTLTYPDRFPDVETAKRDLKVFQQRLNRKFDKAGSIWKLEPQERGAPHYHLLVWGVSWAKLFCWTVDTWYEIAGQGDENHMKFHAGMLSGSKPCVQLVRSFKGVWSYASKYLGKTFEVAEWGSKWTGRFWGVSHPENIPFGEIRQVEIDYREAVQFQRFQRRFAHLKRAQKNSLTIFCDADHWADKIGICLRE